MRNPVLVIHGGAGNIRPELLSAEQKKKAEEGLLNALMQGYDLLQKGGAALDAAEKAVQALEDCPIFNAGYGSVLNANGMAEMDAAIMSGSDLQAGAVAGVTTIRHPIGLARMVLERSDHILLAGKGAEVFGISQGVPQIAPSELVMPERIEQLKKVQSEAFSAYGFFLDEFETYKFGTVGAVALDVNGNLAAATSTGGMVNKKFNRVGDSPLIGAGTYANNLTCAVSCTGQGEYFIRLLAAHSIHMMMESGKYSLQGAASDLIHRKLAALGGQGGLIAVDSKGNFTMEKNTPGMYRAVHTQGAHEVLCF